MPGIFLQAFGFRTTKGFFFASRYGGSLILLSSLTWSSTQYTPVVRTLQNTTLPHIACKKSRTTDARLFLLRRQTCRSDSNAPLRLVRRNFVRRWMSRCGLDDGTPCPGEAGSRTIRTLQNTTSPHIARKNEQSEFILLRAIGEAAVKGSDRHN